MTERKDIQDLTAGQMLKAFHSLAEVLKDCLQKEEEIDSSNIELTDDIREAWNEQRKALAEHQDKLKQSVISDCEENKAKLQKNQKQRLKNIESEYKLNKEKLLEQNSGVRQIKEVKVKKAMDKLWDNYQKALERETEKVERQNKIIDQFENDLKHEISAAKKCLSGFGIDSSFEGTGQVDSFDSLDQLNKKIRQILDQTELTIDQVSGAFLSKLAKSFMPRWLFIGGYTLVMGGLVYAIAMQVFSFTGLGAVTLYAILGAFWMLGCFLVISIIGAAQKKVGSEVRPMAAKCLDGLEMVMQYQKQLKGKFDQYKTKLKDKRDALMVQAEEKLEQSDGKTDEVMEAKLDQLNHKYRELLKKEKSVCKKELAQLQNENEKELARLTESLEKDAIRLKEEQKSPYQNQLDKMHAALKKVKDVWFAELSSLKKKANALRDDLQSESRSWADTDAESWTPEHHFPLWLSLGELEVQLENSLFKSHPNSALLETGHETCSLPVAMEYPGKSSMFVTSEGSLDEGLIEFIQDIALRHLKSHPPGKIQLCLIDPVGLGRHFAGFMKLTESTKCIMGSRILTESKHISNMLNEMSEYIEKVIQKYLMNDYATIDEYNRAAGETAEAYKVLIILDFPNQFDDQALTRLKSIMTSGPRCGVTTLIHTQKHSSLPSDFGSKFLDKTCLKLRYDSGQFSIDDELLKSEELKLHEVANDQLFKEMLLKVMDAHAKAGEVQVPFSGCAPEEKKRWSSISSRNLDVPIGFTGANKLQHFKLGHGTRQHVLIAGRTGSGKSTLFHTLICSLTMWYSPDELELYLIDFKKGVEFKIYAEYELPHAKVIGIESDREFGLNVLKRLDQELASRGEAFREAGVAHLDAFREARPEQKMPRVILLIDEFQEFFVEEDQVSNEAALLLDRLVRQGRAFGIHLILGSQTLAGAYTLARSTMGQIAVRIALQCNETDSSLIFSDDNTAARLLSRPGEAIYNDAAGGVEGNHPFQVAWLDEKNHHHYLSSIQKEFSDLEGHEKPFVFEGNAPGKFEQCQAFKDEAAAGKRKLWIGAANAIGGSCQVEMKPESGQNILLVGQKPNESLSIFLATLLSAGTKASVSLFLHGDALESFSAYQTDFESNKKFRLVVKKEVEKEIERLYKIMKKREQDEAGKPSARWILVHGLQHFRQLAQKDDFSFSSDEDESPAVDKMWAELLEQGPQLGLHTLLWCDTNAHVQNWIGRKVLESFDWRILFQMGSQDSTDLIDTGMAHQLGYVQALLYNTADGRMEKFRPFELPSEKVWKEIKPS